MCGKVGKILLSWSALGLFVIEHLAINVFPTYSTFFDRILHTSLLL